MKKLMTILALCSIATAALASEAELKTVKVSHDVQTLERGVEALMTNCHSCHSLKYITLPGPGCCRDRQAKKVDALRGEQPLSSALLAQMPEAMPSRHSA